MSLFNLQTSAIRKVYPGTVALKDVSIGFRGGEVHALIGKNGAGKSSLVKILSGAQQPTSGQILIEGHPVHLRSPRDAFHQGIRTIYQELSLIPELSVAENIFLGRLPRRRQLGGLAIDWKKAFGEAREVLDAMHVELDVRQKVGSLGVAQQQVVEIARAMSTSPKVLMLDEPTSALAHEETQSLFSLIRKLTARGVSIVYITHRLQELQEVADVLSALRDGILSGPIPIKEASPEKIAEMMFGETVLKSRPTGLKARPAPVLEARGLTRRDKFTDISLTLHEGEVLGIAGMIGSGRTELLRAMAGADPFDSGEIILGGQTIRKPTPARMKRLGLGLTPENRKQEGLVQILSTRDNICLASLDRISLGGLIWKGRQRPHVERTIRELQIAVPDSEAPVSTLSGGNQQKVVVGNWLNTRPRIMFFDEPTRGVDVQAKQQIFEIIRDLSRQGIASIFVSSELEELFEVCHRLLIMRKGRIVGEARPDEMTMETLLQFCMEGFR